MTPLNATPATSAPTPVSSLKHKPRKIVLCFDDAAYPFQSNRSNVLKMSMLLHNDDSQMVYYEVSAHFFIPNALTVCICSRV
jgi:uncharacterized protein (DUF2235 family)